MYKAGIQEMAMDETSWYGLEPTIVHGADGMGAML